MIASEPLCRGALWTPDLVAERIEDGLRCTVNSTARVGPRAYGTAMPNVIREWEDKVHRNFDDWLDEVDAQAARRFTQGEVSRADEALAWPARYLSHDLMRDAVWLVCLARVVPHVQVDRTLAARRRRADAMVARRSESEPDVIRIYEDEAREIAARTAEWANHAMGAPLRPELVPQPRRARRGHPGTPPEDVARMVDEATRARNRRIRQGAKQLFARAAREAGVVERVVVVRRQDVMPGRNFNPRHCYRWFDRGLCEIAAALADEGAEAR